VSGKNDPFFLPAGAEAFKRDMRGGTWILADVLGCLALSFRMRIRRNASRPWLIRNNRWNEAT